MKKLVMVAVAVGIAGMVSGCASPGGMTYIGPVSYLHAQASDKAMMMRSAATSRSIPAEKREPVFRAVSMGAGPNQIAVGVGVDMFALTEGGYTSGEKWMQFGSALVDALLYGAAGYGAQQALTSNGDSNSPKTVNTYSIVNNGDGNNNNINGGSGNQSNNSASDGAANGDVNVTPAKESADKE